MSDDVAAAAAAAAEARAAALDFRARQHGGVPPVVAAHGAGNVSAAAAPEQRQHAGGASAATDADAEADADDVDAGAPDAARVVLHFDCDAFYAQCEELRDPSLRGVPMVRRRCLRRSATIRANKWRRSCALHCLARCFPTRARAHALTPAPTARRWCAGGDPKVRGVAQRGARDAHRNPQALSFLL
jgi:hypothetical protein